jgi:acyl-CoA thioesterase
MLERILEVLSEMDEDELTQVLHLLVAKQQTYHRPLAFLQAVMGFTPLGRDADAYVYEMTIYDELLNRYGIVHGGVLTTFIDTAMAETAFAKDGELQKAVTLNLTVNFVRQAVQGRLRCTVLTEQNSHRIALFFATVTDDEKKVVATATGHFYKTAHQVKATTVN